MPNVVYVFFSLLVCCVSNCCGICLSPICAPFLCYSVLAHHLGCFLVGRSLFPIKTSWWVTFLWDVKRQFGWLLFVPSPRLYGLSTIGGCFRTLLPLVLLFWTPFYLLLFIGTKMGTLLRTIVSPFSFLIGYIFLITFRSLGFPCFILSMKCFLS